MASQDLGRTKGFPCKQCDTVLPSMPSLLEHMETHYRKEEERKFRCDQCGRGYRHPGSLANHKKTHKVGSFQCHICARNLSNLLALKNHLRIHTSGKKFPCLQCGETFRLAAQLATHLKVHHAGGSQGTSEKNEILQETTEYPQNRENADERETAFNEQDISLLSGLSESVIETVPSSSLNDRLTPDFSRDSSIEKETLVSNDTMNRPFKCDQCKRTYRHHGSLINHKKSHQVGVFDCPVCYKQFSNLAALKSHQRIHTKPKSKSGALHVGLPHPSKSPDLCQPVPKNGDVAVHFCHLCEVSFPNDDDFQDHILLHNTSSLSLGLSAGLTDGLSCDFNINQSDNANCCQPSLSDTPPLSSLLDKQESFDQMLEPIKSGQMYTCAYCGQGYSDLDSLKAHSATHQSPSPSNIQGKSTEFQKHDDDLRMLESALANEMKDHESSAADTGERRFKCQVCNKSYRHAGSLINHKNSHQTGVYQCSICRKHYPHLAALRSHLRIHKARPPTMPLSSEGDWLSPEPLTLEGHLGDLQTQDFEDEEAGMLHLSPNLGEAAHINLESSHSNGLDEFEIHETFDTAFPPHRLKQLPLPQGEPHAERHMCADCGETYADIAGIKSHTCPHRHQQQEALNNGFVGDVDIQDPGTKALLEHGGIEIGSRAHMYDPNQRHCRGPDFHENTFMNSGDEADKNEDDDGEVYQCSVCGTHYTNMQTLRNHLHSHTQSQSIATSTGPSSLSSLEEDEEEDLSEGQKKDVSLIICSTCGESFSVEQELQEHQHMHSQTIEDETVLNEGASSHYANGQRDEGMICGMCGVACKDYLQLETHLCSDQGRMEGGKYEENIAAGKIEGIHSGDHEESPDLENRPHKCEQCGRAYRHAGSLLNHKKSHKTGVFRCFVCQKRFYNLLALKNHQRTHFDVKRHKCEECGKAFKIQKQLLNHMRIHKENRARVKELNQQLQTLIQANRTESNGGPDIHNVNAKMDDKSSSWRRNSRPRGRGTTVHCNRCGGNHSCKVCPAVGTLVEPQVEVKSEEGGNDHRPYACDQCGRTYRHAGSLVNHKNSHKTGEYYCSVCNNTYSNQLAMKNHLRIHFAVKKHTCQDCGKAFRGQKQLSTHARSHRRKKARTTGGRGGANRRVNEGKVTKCKESSQAFTSAAELLSHTSELQLPSASTEGHLNGVKNEPCGGAQAGEKEERPFGCSICGRTYRHAGSLLNHKNTHKTGHFNCSFCAKPFSNPMALRNHTRIHTQKKKHVCTTCGKAFRLASILHNHQNIHIRGDIHFNCPVCGKSFQGRSGLKRHRCQKNQEGRKKATESRAEGRERCFTCEECGRSYRHAGSLLNHKKTHTTGIYHCNICLKTFSNLLALKNHRRIHSEVRRHCCPDCGKTFRVSSHLHSHRRVHSKEQSVSCTPCQRTFPSSTSLQQHQELHSQMQQHTMQQSDLGGEEIGADFNWGSGLDLSLMQAQGLDPNGLPRLASSFSCLDNSHPSELQKQQDSHGAEAKGAKVHVCEHCGRTYRHAGSLLNHKNSHKIGCFFCSACQKEFSNLMALKNHRRIHTEPKRFQCPECGKAFRVSTQLICHRRIHTKEKPFSCSQCDKHFSSKSNLRHHQKVHQSQQNFEATLDTSANSFMGLSMSPFL